MSARKLSTLACAGLLALTWSLAGARAQAPAEPPKGPADIMNRAAQGRERSDVKRAEQTGNEAAAQSAGAPQEAPSQGAAPRVPNDAAHAAAHGGRDPHAVLSEPELPSASPKPGTPTGSIEIEVLGPTGAPQAGAEIVLGVMASMGSRTEQRATADASGRHVFRGLAVGSQQAYRVNVMYEGAKFSSTPFRLPEDSGYAVRIPLRSTTSDTALMFQVIGQTAVELRDDRLHVTQQARLANAGDRVIVFPKDGLLVPLPEGFTAFQWQEQMTDQKGEEVAGQGFKLRGSLPSGSVTLAWSYDLHLEGSSARIAVNQPWRTYTYRVVSEAPEGMKLRVTDFPEPELIKDERRKLFFTQIQRRPSDPQLGSFTIRLDGIPGPGPGRWFAVAIALMAVGYGLARAFRGADDVADRKAALAARKRELIELAKATEGEHERGEIGPHFRSERLNEILTELALVLRDEETLAKSGKPSAQRA